MTASLATRLEVPSARTRYTGGAIARTLVHRIVSGMPVRLRYPDGSDVGGGSCGAPVIDVARPDVMFRRL